MGYLVYYACQTALLLSLATPVATAPSIQEEPRQQQFEAYDQDKTFTEPFDMYIDF